MIRQSFRYAVTGAALATAVVGATQQAHALTSVWMIANGSLPFVDNPMNPVGTTLQASLNINAAGCGSDITASNSGAFSNKLEWRCGTNPATNTLNASGFNDVWFSDLSGLCSFGTPVSWAQATIDDI